MTGRRIPLIAILDRLRWQRDPHLWTIPCRDADGRCAVLRVQVRVSGVAVSASCPGDLTFAPLAVGRLRAALRDAVVAHAVLSTDCSSTKEVDHDFDNSSADRVRPDSHAA